MITKKIFNSNTIAVRIKKLVKRIFSVFAILLTLSFYACEKEISLNLPAVEKKIVIQGSIEINQNPLVIISTNSPYFTTVDSVTLVNMIVRDAKVYVSDGISTDTLTMTMIPYFPFFAYTSTHIRGEVGKIYNLTVITGGQTYTASTIITLPERLDTMYFKPESTKGDSLGYIWSKYTGDQSNIKYYRGYSERLHKDNRFIPLFGSMFDGQFLTGQTIAFYMSRGVDNWYANFSDQDKAEFGYFKVGDTVVMKICTMDKIHYDFWKAIEKDLFSGNSPFGTPSTIPTNIKGGALGIWGGFGSSYDTVICKK